MKKALGFIFALILLVNLTAVCQAEAAPTDAKPLIGIAWRADTDSAFFTNVCRAVEEAGGDWVMLDQVLSADLKYDGKNRLTEGVTALGTLDEAAAKLIRINTWHDSNAADTVKDVSLMLFTGGEDISPALSFSPEPWHGIVEEIDYNAERDVSDYLTMSYCLDHDIPVVGFCRGMQMLSVVSGAEIIQDLPAYFAELGLEYNYEHRNQKSSPDAFRDYAPHDVLIRPDSFLYEIVQTNRLVGCPSWHHQAVKSVDHTRLAVTGYEETNGVDIIEAVERTDKTCAVGLQFHPEAALIKSMENAENQHDFMDYETALSIFRWIMREAAPLELTEAA